jgi:hypothetical protein
MEQQITLPISKFKEMLIYSWHLLPLEKQHELIVEYIQKRNKAYNSNMSVLAMAKLSSITSPENLKSEISNLQKIFDFQV